MSKVHSMLVSTLSLFTTGLILFTLILRSYLNKRSNPLPPGPRPLPFLGNIFQVPRSDVAATFAGWRKLYGKFGAGYRLVTQLKYVDQGDVIYLHILGREFVILNTAEAALELFDDRGILYSDRPRSVMADMVGKSRAILFHPYGDRLKKARRLLRNAYNPQRSRDYWQLEEAESHKLIAALFETPENVIAHLRQYYGAIALRLAYGYQVKALSGEDYFVNMTDDIARITDKASRPGRWLVDSFPWLRYMPWWLPGAGFKRWANSVRHRIDEFASEPYKFSKSATAADAGHVSFVSESTELLESESGHPLSAEDDDLLKWTAASIYSGDSDSAVAFTSSFLILMAAHPEVQRRAQAELDSVVGNYRLPRMEDQANLPYIEALIKEVHRFNPVAPLIPHTTLSDDIYRGYRIPKGSWIMANTWAMTHDPEVFPEPEFFVPERFLKEGGACPIDPRDFTFGFGRRRCPGISVAESSLFFAVTHILALFTIASPRDEAGNQMRPAFADGYLSHPKPFTCRIMPRGKAAVDLILQLGSS